MLHHEPKTAVDHLRRGALYGAALGLFAGLVRVRFAGLEGTDAIDVWRNWILGGACAGLLVGTIRALLFKPEDECV